MDEGGEKGEEEERRYSCDSCDSCDSFQGRDVYKRQMYNMVMLLDNRLDLQLKVCYE